MDIKAEILQRYNLKETPVVNIPKSRWKEMAPLFKDLGFKVGAEIGVFRGQFLKNLCQEFKMFGIDPWEDYKDITIIKEEISSDMSKNLEIELEIAIVR